MTGPEPNADVASSDAFARELARFNRGRLRVFLPLMVIVHLTHIAIFRTPDTLRVTLASQIIRWRGDLVLAHAVMLPVAAVLGAMLVLPRVQRIAAPLTALAYVVHGAVVAAIDQLTAANATTFVGFALGSAVVVCLSPRSAFAVFGIGATTFIAGLLRMQASPSVRLSLVNSGCSIAAVSFGLSWMLYAARRREFGQRVTIDLQRDELARLNQGLERRVSEQVAEIVTRAEQVEQLNAQLRARIRARSSDLSMALAKLARHREVDGTLRKGVVLGDRFEIGDLLGTGGMGAVYQGLDRSSGAPVAIKVIQASSSSQLDALHRFFREAGTVAAVTHPAVVRMVHVDVSEDGMLFQAQELIVGETLHQRLRPGRKWDPRIAARMLSVLSDALAAAHAAGVVHRDVKPANVMLTASAPGLKLVDFGISKLLEVHDNEGMTGTGMIVGTPAFMAPEQVSDSASVADRADVYAVGMILFVMLAGRYPFEEASPRRMMISHLLDVPPDVRTFAPGVPDALANLVARCLQKQPEDRPTATETARMLVAFADETDTPVLDALERNGDLRFVDEHSQEDAPTAVALKAGRSPDAAMKS